MVAQSAPTKSDNLIDISISPYSGFLPRQRHVAIARVIQYQAIGYGISPPQTNDVSCQPVTDCRAGLLSA
jgi:hypothetical protein